ncbi:conserved hypothetical protein [gamma proteobacterium HTCC5015]|nr:conserved hypothetical protein [gamma proteobacterium HTCC5015]
MMGHLAEKWLFIGLCGVLSACSQHRQIVYQPQQSPASSAQAERPVEPSLKLAVITTGDDVMYQSVAKYLLDHSADSELFNIKNGQRSAAVASVVGRDEYDRVAAIGLPAARLASEMRQKRVVFSKVFNHSPALELSANLQCVSLLPSPQQVFQRWRELSPTLNRVAVITGAGHDHLVAVIKEAGEAWGIHVQAFTVRNDKELVYVSKNLPHSIQGQWLMPDNRVTSRDALRELMGHAVRVGRQVVAFDDSLLEIGALASVTTTDRSIAKAQQRALANHREIKMHFPESFAFKVSDKAKSRLGLTRKRQRE